MSDIHKGSSFDDFLIEMEIADRIADRDKALERAFFAALLSPPKSSAKAWTAARQYKEMFIWDSNLTGNPAMNYATK